MTILPAPGTLDAQIEGAPKLLLIGFVVVFLQPWVQGLGAMSAAALLLYGSSCLLFLDWRSDEGSWMVALMCALPTAIILWFFAWQLIDGRLQPEFTATSFRATADAVEAMVILICLSRFLLGVAW